MLIYVYSSTLLVPFLYPILLIPPVSFPFSDIYDPVTNATPRINTRVTVKESGRTLMQVFVLMEMLVFTGSRLWHHEAELCRKWIQFARSIGLTNAARAKSACCNMRPLGFIRDLVVCVMMEDVQLLHNNLMLPQLRERRMQNAGHGDGWGKTMVYIKKKRYGKDEKWGSGNKKPSAIKY